jgi:hypothetical protein
VRRGIDVDSVPLFTKRIPLTDQQVADSGSTANRFDLPMFCQYGVGGPNFDARRQPAANTILTDAVLAGLTQSLRSRQSMPPESRCTAMAPTV